MICDTDIIQGFHSHFEKLRYKISIFNRSGSWNSPQAKIGHINPYYKLFSKKPLLYNQINYW